MLYANNSELSFEIIIASLSFQKHSKKIVPTKKDTKQHKSIGQWPYQKLKAVFKERVDILQALEYKRDENFEESWYLQDPCEVNDFGL